MRANQRPELSGRQFSWAQPLVLGFFVGPIMLGLLGTFLPSFGIQPAFGRFTLSVVPWQDFWSAPGLFTSLRLTLTIGFGATLLAVVIGFGGVAQLYGTPIFDRLRTFLAPALAFPHASFALGLTLLIAPSGWIAKALSPWATGWQQPPDLLIIHDPNGITLMLALALKETLFLVLMIVSALGQVDVEAALRSAQSMGYSKTRAWLFIIGPQIYAQVRLPIYAILVTALSYVDMAIILGPTAPPTLTPLILGWFKQLEPARQLMASAACMFQLLMVVSSILLWYLGERLAGIALKSQIVVGKREGWSEKTVGLLGVVGIHIAFVTSLGAIIVLLLWSFTGSWFWPAAMPQKWSALTWISTAPALIPLIARTIAIGAGASLIAIVLAILCLEAGIGRAKSRWLNLIFLPLLIPQISFLFGLQLMWNAIWLDGTVTAVMVTHLLFVLPYVFLVLSDPYRALDPRLAIAARSLGKSAISTLIQIKIPLLGRPLANALAIGFAVSIGQYLPTVFAGAGQIDTLTTQAIALASGADRRLAANGCRSRPQHRQPPNHTACPIIALPDLTAHHRYSLTLVKAWTAARTRRAATPL
jgi:putative thiamine transport system permease protein